MGFVVAAITLTAGAIYMSNQSKSAANRAANNAHDIAQQNLEQQNRIMEEQLAF